jgi:hypothetical protein
MLPQLGHQMRRQGDGTPSVARLRPLDSDPAGARFLKRLLDRQPPGGKIDVLPAEITFARIFTQTRFFALGPVLN